MPLSTVLYYCVVEKLLHSASASVMYSRQAESGGQGAKSLLLKITSLIYYYSPTTFFDLSPDISCVLFSLVTHVQSRTSLQYSIAAVVVYIRVVTVCM